MSKWKKGITIGLVMALFCLCLTGCSFVKAETTIQVSVDTDGKTVKAVLKADQSQGYEWKYLIANGALSESASRFENNIFSDTYIQKYSYTYNVSKGNEDQLIFVLIKDKDYENAKAYEYPVTIDDTGSVKIGNRTEKTVGYYPDLLKAIQ